MTLYTWIQLSLVCLLGAMSPGPSVALIINNTIIKDRLNGIITAIGHGLGVAIYALLAVLGLNVLIENFLDVFIGFQIAGSCFLIFIGLQTIIVVQKNNINDLSKEKIVSKKAFLQGFFIAFLNPKILVFFASLFSQFIYSDASGIDKLILVLTPGVIDTVWYIFVSIIITQATINNYINQNRNIIQRLTGSLLVLIAVILLFKLF